MYKLFNISFQGFTEARKDQLDILKLALSKNLAKAILQEGTVKLVWKKLSLDLPLLTERNELGICILQDNNSRICNQ